jgi:hypothetical protein
LAHNKEKLWHGAGTRTSCMILIVDTHLGTYWYKKQMQSFLKDRDRIQTDFRSQKLGSFFMKKIEFGYGKIRQILF